MNGLDDLLLAAGVGQRPRLDRDDLAISAQFPAIDVELTAGEAQDQPASVLPARIATIPVAASIS